MILKGAATCGSLIDSGELPGFQQVLVEYSFQQFLASGRELRLAVLEGIGFQFLEANLPFNDVLTDSIGVTLITLGYEILEYAVLNELRGNLRPFAKESMPTIWP